MARVTTVVVPKPEFDALVEEVERLRAEREALLDQDRTNELQREVDKLRADFASMKRCHDADALKLGRLRVELEDERDAADALTRAGERLRRMVSKQADTIRTLRGDNHEDKRCPCIDGCDSPGCDEGGGE